MPLFIESNIRARAQKEKKALHKSYAATLTERIQKQINIAPYDIFLSHSFQDLELISGMISTIEDMGYSTYLDWREDPSLDRKNISAQTAQKLRLRMKESRCLLYLTTEHASQSKWMPWELGFKDGSNSRVAVLPIAQEERTKYQGQEYLGIYPYIKIANEQKSGRPKLWVEKNPKCYVSFDKWLDGKKPYNR